MLRTTHKIFFENSRTLTKIKPESVDLVVTSPPYPMIEMWDDIFAGQNRHIADALKKNEGMKAFELMHQILDSVWAAAFMKLKKGGFACINIGDATRTINENFALYPNHARIISKMMELGFTPLPDIIWRKQTNAPNKFMGSGMLPAGAYVTFEHEYILVFRKGGKRDFSDQDDKINRNRSAYFWEERNIFFSDVWLDVKGTVQSMKKSDARSRSGAFPFELAYRLICMYSAKGDTVLDPFMGTGTTMLAAMASARNSLGFEIDKKLADEIAGLKDIAAEFSNNYIRERLARHALFVEERIKSGKEVKYTSSFYGFPVMTRQEKEILLNELTDITESGKNEYTVSYKNEPGTVVFNQACSGQETEKPAKKPRKTRGNDSGNGQMNLW